MKTMKLIEDYQEYRSVLNEMPAFFQEIGINLGKYGIDFNDLLDVEDPSSLEEELSNIKGDSPAGCLFKALLDKDLDKTNLLMGSQDISLVEVSKVMLYGLISAFAIQDAKLTSFLIKECNLSSSQSLLSFVLRDFYDDKEYDSNFFKPFFELELDLTFHTGRGSCTFYRMMHDRSFTDDYLISQLGKVHEVHSENNKGSLVGQAINTSRLPLMHKLIETGADVNFSLHQGCNITLEVLEALVESKKLELTDNDSTFSCQGTDGKPWSVKELSNGFNAVNIAKSCTAWLGNGEIHSWRSLQNALIKFGNVNLEEFYPKYKKPYNEVSKNLISSILSYMSNNWYKSMLVCKKFGEGAFGLEFCPEELSKVIGSHLVHSYFLGSGIHSVTEVTGDNTDIDG